MSRKRKKKNNAKKYILIATLVLVFLVLGYNVIKLYQKNLACEEKLNRLEEAYEVQEEREEELTLYEEFTKTIEFVEKIAREKLGLVFGNEIIFKQDE